MKMPYATVGTRHGRVESASDPSLLKARMSGLMKRHGTESEKSVDEARASPRECDATRSAAVTGGSDAVTISPGPVVGVGDGVTERATNTAGERQSASSVAPQT